VKSTSSSISLSFIKGTDVALRAVSLALPLYVLDQKGTIEFGIFSLGMSLFIFICGFEAYFLLLKQREPGEGCPKALIKSIWRFYCINWLLCGVPTVLLLRGYGMGWESILYSLIIYVCEHIYHELYRTAYSTRVDLQGYMIQSALKSAMVTVVLAILTVLGMDELGCPTVLRMWALVDVIFVLGLKPWRWIKQKGHFTSYIGIFMPSCLQFLVGCTGLLGAQIERIGAIGILNEESLAVAFRVIALGSITLQIGNLTIYNSSAYRLFQKLQAGEKDKFWKDAIKQINRMMLLCIVIGSAIYALEILNIENKMMIKMPAIEYINLMLGVSLMKIVYEIITMPVRVENKESILLMLGLISGISSFLAIKWLGGMYGVLGVLVGCYIYPCTGILGVVGVSISYRRRMLY